MKTTLWDLAKHVSVLLVALPGVILNTGCNSTSNLQYETVKLPPAMNYQFAGKNQNIQNTAIKSENSVTPADSVSTLQTLPPSRWAKNQIVSRKQIMKELRSKGLSVVPTVNDHKYIVPQHDWVSQDYNKYFNWYLYFLSAEYNAEGMDCDNFANFYQQNLVLANLKAGGARHGDVPCATMIVHQWDKKIYHALNLIRTDRGWYVVEPQDGNLIGINNYRYRDHITKVTF